MIFAKNVASAVGAKTARACDSCIIKRARWYCAADDAFLCQACDSSVHSANPLARRHERVRLKTASFKSSDEPSWHRGFTRKARTPRHGGKPVNHQTPKSEEPLRNPFSLVPEVGADEASHEEHEEQLLYRVPIYDPFVAELCSTSSDTSKERVTAVTNDEEIKVSVANCGHDVDNLQRFLPTDMDLAEFAADVESLLGRDLENESFGIEGLGLLDCKEKEMKDQCSGRVKFEEEDGGAEAVTAASLVDDTEIDMMREPFELSFDYDSPATCEEEKEEKVAVGVVAVKNEAEDAMKEKKMLLRLDYEAVVAAWASQRSPWTTGDRPDFNPDQCWPHCMGTCGAEIHHPYGDFGGYGGHPAMAGGGREARVSRYREKRRTRLFSKKIRYEVRKLNAEKRPRMKGRFVKRASFVGPGFPLLGK